MRRNAAIVCLVIAGVLAWGENAVAGIATGFFTPQPNTTIDFPGQVVGTSSVQTRSLVATATAGTVLRISADAATGPGFFLDVASTTCAIGTNYANGQACAVGVGFAPTTATVASGSFSLTCTTLGVIGAIALVCDGVSHAFALSGTGFASAAPIAAPTLSQVGITALAMMLLGLAGFSIRRLKR